MRIVVARGGVGHRTTVCDQTKCRFFTIDEERLYVCCSHMRLHECGSLVGESGCEFALQTRECLACPVSARTWLLEPDSFAQQLVQGRDTIGDGEGGGGGGTGEETRQPAAGAGDERALVSAEVVRSAVPADFRPRPNQIGDAEFVRETAACIEGARQVLRIITQGRVRMEINEKKTAKSIERFNMAVRRYSQFMADQSRPASIYMLLCLFGHAYPDIARYSGDGMSGAEETRMCEDAVQLWMRMRVHGFSNVKVNACAPTHGRRAAAASADTLVCDADGRPLSATSIQPILCGATASAASSYHFSFHCLVVFTHMRTGYRLFGKEVVKAVPCAKVVPTPRDMHAMGFAERRITTHMATFATTFASIVGAGDSSAM